eukprot:1144107-Rhodomonas_salina.1
MCALGFSPERVLCVDAAGLDLCGSVLTRAVSCASTPQVLLDNPDLTEEATGQSAAAVADKMAQVAHTYMHRHTHTHVFRAPCPTCPVPVETPACGRCAVTCDASRDAWS